MAAVNKRGISLSDLWVIEKKLQAKVASKNKKLYTRSLFEKYLI